MKIIVGIATTGRRDQMQLTLVQLAKQKRLPSRVIVCPASSEDFDESHAFQLRFPVEVVIAQRGLCAQRNAVLAAGEDADVILFIDDDYYPADDYIDQLHRLFSQQEDVVVSTNQPIADGATGPGISHDDAMQIIDKLPAESSSMYITPTYGGYGCNIALRMSVVRRESVRFDERLPFYGWLEDIDFSRRIAPYGRIVNCSALRGVHLGTKVGRTSGVRFGYSQIANPLYMIDKGSLSPSYAWKHIVKHMLKNCLYSLRPEPWVDRRGRLKGNLLAWRDLFLRKLDPDRIRYL